MRGAHAVLAAAMTAWQLGCSSPTDKAKGAATPAARTGGEALVPEAAELILKVSAAPSGAVGYGVIYRCKIHEVIKGNFASDEIHMTVLASDHAYDQFLFNHKPPAVLEVGFKKHKEDEPYSLMPITGFVDARRASWRLLYAR